MVRGRCHKVDQRRRTPFGNWSLRFQDPVPHCCISIRGLMSVWVSSNLKDWGCTSKEHTWFHGKGLEICWNFFFITSKGSINRLLLLNTSFFWPLVAVQDDVLLATSADACTNAAFMLASDADLRYVMIDVYRKVLVFGAGLILFYRNETMVLTFLCQLLLASA